MSSLRKNLYNSLARDELSEEKLNNSLARDELSEEKLNNCPLTEINAWRKQLEQLPEEKPLSPEMN